jgi:hypothetical protein
MKLSTISEIQDKGVCTSMERNNIATQLGSTNINDTLHQPTTDPRKKQKLRQKKLNELIRA